MDHAKLAVLISRNWYGRYRCRFGGLLVPLAPLPLTAVRVGAGTLVIFGDYQIAPIAAQSTAMGRWRLTPPWYWGDTACGRGMGRFVPRHEYLSFFCKKKGTKENHLDLRSKGPLARGGQVQIWRYALAHEVQWVTLSVQGSLVPLAPLPLTTARVGAGALVVFGDYQIAPLAPCGGKGRCARRAQDIIIS